MPPTTDFVKIARNKVLPLRIFVNKRSIISKSKRETDVHASSGRDVLTAIPAKDSGDDSGTGTSVHHRAMIKLSRCYKVMLSARDRKDLIYSFKEQLVKYLIETDIEKLSETSKNFIKDNELIYNEFSNFSNFQKDKYILPLKNDKWDCFVVLSTDSIQYLRNLLFSYDDEDGLSVKRQMPYSTLLIRSSSIKKSGNGYGDLAGSNQNNNILVEDEDEVSIPSTFGVVPVKDKNSTEDKKTVLKYKYTKSTVLPTPIDIHVCGKLN
ncbi:hypothetical protein B5S33_g4609 [[Candida] boidinii]|nr:hypothetical protein B5S30_g5440 [[Candida] boidinii]OWB85933.1 hypothetical protein B5S33_g4609 [[Candida] boidinii]